ncbi:hypothetical protein GcM1_218051 [Golovinomyces cichoracearum]|uniref:Uncharacterized protein n=1 Tax=Golovinomyces cichoracearum TaxID=62708 RepID=A0A420ISS8_9PEZI|nr:hypothetical protein GcM1_218051 [Golovinomyces cichoracearum]
MSHSSSEDGAQTPETVTESLKSIHLNDTKTVDCARKTNQKVKLVPALPSMFVWCLCCAVLVRIDYPIHHRIDDEYPCDSGNSLFLTTVCLNCLELKNASKKDGKNGLASRSQLIDRTQEAVYISPDCVKKCSAFEKATSLTQISCENQFEIIHGINMSSHASIKELNNLCDEECRLRTVVTDQRRTEDYENFMVAGFI